MGLMLHIFCLAPTALPTGGKGANAAIHPRSEAINVHAACADRPYLSSQAGFLRMQVWR